MLCVCLSISFQSTSVIFYFHTWYLVALSAVFVSWWKVLLFIFVHFLKWHGFYHPRGEVLTNKKLLTFKVTKTFSSCKSEWMISYWSKPKVRIFSCTTDFKKPQLKFIFRKKKDRKFSQLCIHRKNIYAHLRIKIYLECTMTRPPRLKLKVSIKVTRTMVWTWNKYNKLAVSSWSILPYE